MNKTEHPLYSTWIEMKRRCNNNKTISYNRYGGRGIKVCKRWNVDFKSFVKSIGDKPTKSHSLDRIDNNGNYNQIIVNGLHMQNKIEIDVIILYIKESVPVPEPDE